MTLDTTKLYYLSHPFTSFGDREENRRDAAEIAEKLWLKYGIAVVNPLAIKMPDYQAVAMNMCFSLTDPCDAIIICEQWTDSEGCCAEWDYAVKKDKEVYFIHELL